MDPSRTRFIHLRWLGREGGREGEREREGGRERGRVKEGGREGGESEGKREGGVVMEGSKMHKKGWHVKKELLFTDIRDGEILASLTRQ